MIYVWQSGAFVPARKKASSPKIIFTIFPAASAIAEPFDEKRIQLYVEYFFFLNKTHFIRCCLLTLKPYSKYPAYEFCPFFEPSSFYRLPYRSLLYCGSKLFVAAPFIENAMHHPKSPLRKPMSAIDLIDPR
jgi:hypothetical protein